MNYIRFQQICKLNDQFRIHILSKSELMSTIKKNCEANMIKTSYADLSRFAVDQKKTLCNPSVLNYIIQLTNQLLTDYFKFSTPVLLSAFFRII